MMAHAFNPSTPDTETGRSLQQQKSLAEQVWQLLTVAGLNPKLPKLQA